MSYITYKIIFNLTLFFQKFIRSKKCIHELQVYPKRGNGKEKSNRDNEIK